jgi:hypothetical protein
VDSSSLGSFSSRGDRQPASKRRDRGATASTTWEMRLVFIVLVAMCLPGAARGVVTPALARSVPRLRGGGAWAQARGWEDGDGQATPRHYHTEGCTGCPTKSTPIEFAVRCSSTQLGQRIGIVGLGNALGDWKTPIVMDCEDTWPLWQATIKLPETGLYEYKYVLIGEDGEILEWEDASPWKEGNRSLNLNEGSLKQALHVDDGQFGVYSKPIYTVSVLVRVRVESV